MSSISENISRIRDEMLRAEAQAGRQAGEVLLLAATKMNSVENVRAAIAAGVDACGENRAQELREKYAQGAYDGAPLHFIGRLQKNKAKYLVGVVDLIQSVDSEELLPLLNRLAAGQNLRQDILIEVNIGGEAAKSGIRPEQADEISAKISEFPNIHLRGFMAIPPISEAPGENSRYFSKMYQLFVDIRAKKYDNTDIDCLSMGMSNDFADAIREGSTMIRVGTQIFGARQYKKTDLEELP